MNSSSAPLPAPEPCPRPFSNDPNRFVDTAVEELPSLVGPSPVKQWVQQLGVWVCLALTGVFQDQCRVPDRICRGLDALRMENLQLHPGLCWLWVCCFFLPFSFFPVVFSRLRTRVSRHFFLFRLSLSTWMRPLRTLSASFKSDDFLLASGRAPALGGGVARGVRILVHFGVLVLLFIEVLCRYASLETMSGEWSRDAILQSAVFVTILVPGDS